MEWTNNEFCISTDLSRLQINVIHAFLRESYWSPGIPRDLVEKSIRESICFGLYLGGDQIGFARVITDSATFAYLADVFVLEGYRGRGLSKWLMECIMSYPELQGLRRFMLATRDAHGLYRQFGFTELKTPDRIMERSVPDIYLKSIVHA